MFGFKHTYYHTDGHPLARILTYYINDPVGMVIDKRMQHCWGQLASDKFSSISILPSMTAYAKINNKESNEFIWGWSSEEEYHAWYNSLTQNNVKVGEEWLEIAEVIGPPISDSLGVSQVHLPPMENILPSNDMYELSIDELLLDYSVYLN